MTLSTWIRRCFVRQSSSHAPIVRCRKPKVRARIRPTVEVLEDRFAPAVLTVNTLTDGTGDTSHLDLREALTLVNHGGNPASLNQSSMPAGWASQISGVFGSNDTIQFDPSLLTQSVGFGLGVIGLTMVGDGTAGPSALGVDSNVKIIGPSTGPGITIERPATLPGINVPNMRLFYVGSSGSLTLDNLTLQGGMALGGNAGGDGGGGAGLGGAVFNQGQLTIQNSLLTGNAARGGAGYTGFGGGGGGMGGNGTQGVGRDGNGGPYAGYGGGPNAGNPNGGLAGYSHGLYVSVNGGFGGGGSATVGTGNNGGFGGGGGGDNDNNRAGGSSGGDGGFGGGGAGGTVYKDAGMAGVSEFGGGEGTTSDTGEGSGGGGAGFGGALFNDQGTVFITDTTITGNLAAAGPSPGHAGMGAGAGIFNYNGKVTVNYSTLVQNYAAQGGAEIYNLADGSSGSTAVLTLNDSILADSQGSSEDLHSAAINGGIPVLLGTNNLIMSSTGAPTTSPFLIGIADPKLGPLQNNGGPTLTMAPLPGSPIIDVGTGSTGLGVTTDARGQSRIYDFSSVSNIPGGDGSDLGAVEVRPATITVSTTADTVLDPNNMSLRLAVELADGIVNPASLTSAQQALVQGSPSFGTTIQFASSLAGQTIHLSAEDDNSDGPTALLVTSNVSIVGPSGNQGVTLAGPGSSGNLRLFRVAPGVSLTLDNLTLQGGNAVGQQGGNAVNAGGGGGGSAGLGGAIFNQGNLTLINSTLTGDTAQGGAGGRSSISYVADGGGGGGGLQSGGGTGNASGGGAGGSGGGAAGGAGNRLGNAGAGATGGYFGGGGGGGSGFRGGPGGMGGIGGGGGGGGASFEASYLAGASGTAGAFGGPGGGGGTTGYVGLQGGGGGGGGAGLGGALFNDLGNVTVVNSTFYGDKAVGGAGGGGTAGHTGSAGQGAGGALFNYQGYVVITDSTLAGNSANRGGGIFDDSPLIVSSPLVSLTNSIVANSSGGADYDRSNTSGPESVGSNDLIVHNAGFEGGVVSSANPLLGPLQNNGGPTQTLYPLAGSPVIDAGTDIVVPIVAQLEGVATATATDQLGKARVFGSHVDIGAVEYHPVATSLKFKAPASATAGVADTVQVKVLDQFGHVLNSDNSDQVTLKGAPFVSGNTTATVQNGIATFSNLVIDTAGSYTLTAASGALTSAQTTLTVVGPPVGVDIHGQPSNGVVGQLIGGPITVAVVDANGNTITTNNTQLVTLAIATGPAGAKLGGTTTVAAVNGVATFTNLTLNLPGTYTLTATGGTLTADFSNPFTISAATTPPASSPPALSVPLLLEFFDQLLHGIETVNADGTATVTDSLFGLPLLVSTFDASGHLENVAFLGINVTFLFAR